MCKINHGTISFDGQDLHIEDPTLDGLPAVLSADADIHLRVNDQFIQQPTPVTTQSQIHFSLPLPTQPLYRFHFDISTHRVLLTVELKAAGTTFFIPQFEPSAQLHLSVHQKELPLTAFKEEILKDLQKQLRYERIHQPLISNAFLQALKFPGQSVCVLDMPKPVHPFNRLSFLYGLSLPIRSAPFSLAFPVLTLVKAGKVIVEREFSEKKRSGMSVYGEVIAPHDVVVPELKAANRTVRLDPDKNHALSLIEGVPIFSAEAGVQMSGLQKQEAPIVGGPGHIVDLKTSLQLATHIRENAHVWVQGYLEIGEDMSHSVVEAQSGLVVHGSVIRSNVRVGGDAAARMQLKEPVLDLLKTIHHILRMVKEVRSRAPHSRTTDDKTLFMRVIKTQFSGFNKEVETLWNLNKSLKQLHPRRNMALKVVLSHFLNLVERPLNARLFADWVQSLEDFARELVALPEQANHAFFQYAQGANIMVRGSIVVMGEGCYNSHLKSGQHVFFTGEPGYCREGRLEAEGDVFVPALGSPNGSRLRVSLSKHSKVYAETIYPGVELSFGDQPAYHVLNKQKNVWVQSIANEIAFSPLTDTISSYYPTPENI